MGVLLWHIIRFFAITKEPIFLHIFMLFEKRLIGGHGISNVIYIYIYMAIVMSFLRFTESNYHFGIFKIFLITNAENIWCTDLPMFEIIVVTL